VALELHSLAAWRLGFRGGRERQRRGFIWGRCVAEGLGFAPDFQRGVQLGHVRRAVFVPVVLRKMTDGAHSSAAEGGGRGNVSE
jgi:hypothetical protein